MVMGKLHTVFLTSLFTIGIVWASFSPVSAQKPDDSYITGQVINYVPFDEPIELPNIPFYDQEVNPITFELFKGDVLLINFWATYCLPCLTELPDLDGLHHEYKDKGFEVVAISLEKSMEMVIGFYSAKGITMPKYMDRHDAVKKAFGVEGLPATFIADRRGNVVGYLQGAIEWDSPEAHRLLEFYIKQK